MKEENNLIHNLPAKFSTYTIAGFIFIGGGILLGYLYNRELGFTIGVLGIIFILFNSYLRDLIKSEESIKMINPKALKYSWLAILGVNFAIFRLPYTVVFLGFMVGIILRIVNIILHRIETSNRKKINTMRLTLLICASISLIFITFFPYCSIVQGGGSGGIFIDITWRVANVVGFIVYILILSIFYFPILTGFDYLLNCDNQKEERRKYIVSGIKILLLEAIIIVLYLLNMFIEYMIIIVFIDISVYIGLIPGILLILSGITLKIKKE